MQKNEIYVSSNAGSNSKVTSPNPLGSMDDLSNRKLQGLMGLIEVHTS